MGACRSEVSLGLGGDVGVRRLLLVRRVEEVSDLLRLRPGLGGDGRGRCRIWRHAATRASERGLRRERLGLEDSV